MSRILAACFLVVSFMVVSQATSTQAVTEKCHISSAKCFSQFLETKDEAKYGKCLDKVSAKFDQEICGGCALDRQELVKKSAAAIKLSSQSSSALSMECYSNCYHEDLHTCNSESFVDCLWECAASKKLNIEVDLPVVPSTTDSDDTASCHAELEVCIRDAVNHYDAIAYSSCMNSALAKYGYQACIPCLFSSTSSFDLNDTLKSWEVNFSTKVSDDIKDCVVDCAMQFFNDCDNDASAHCQAACYPPATEDGTEQCQDDLDTCFLNYMDSYDQIAFSNCVNQTMLEQGPATCVPCAFPEDNSVVKTTQGISIKSDHVDVNCALTCWDQYLNTCNNNDMETCFDGCSTSSIVSEQAITIESSPSTSFSTPLFLVAVVACAAVIAVGVTAYKKRRVQNDYVYDQLMA